MEETSNGIRFSLSKESLMPQEEVLETTLKRRSLSIGIPRESDPYENRVSLTPEAVEILVNEGHQVILEHDAGRQASYSDHDYSECGAMIVDTVKEVLQSDLVLKVSPLTFEEASMLKGGQTIISSLHLTNHTEKYIRKLMQKKVTAIAFENIRDKFEHYPVVRSMSEIAGLASILIAGEYMSNVHKGKGVLLGGVSGITPTEVVILGAGTAAEYAARAALGLGAVVKVFDSSVYKLKRLQTYLGERIQTSIFHPRVLTKALKSADVVIGAVHLTGTEKKRYIITEEMVKGMKSGAVIVDISIDQGGCVETSECRDHGNPVYTRHGVIHYCVANIPSRVARTASIALSNVFTPILMDIGDAGGIENRLREDPGLRKGVYLFKGILTNAVIGRRFGILSKDLDLLLAAF